MSSYRYGSVGRHYLCLDQTPLEFFTVVLCLNRDFARRLLDTSSTKLIKALAMLLARGLGLKTGRAALQTEHKGQIARRVNGGVRVFDFRAGEVTKVFDAEVDAAASRAEIEAVKRASSLSFAPRLIREGHDGASYTEELWRGRPAAVPRRGFSSGREHTFLRTQLEPFAAALAELAVAGEPRRVSCGERLAVVMRGTEPWLAEARDRDRAAADFVEGYIAAAADFLGGQDEVFLTFSHGDFSLINVIADGRQWRVIDWEDGKERVALTDLYSLFTTELYYGRDSEELVEWAKACVDEFLRAAGQVHADFERSLRESPERYRAWAHLERLWMLMGRGADERRIEVVRRSAEIFQRFDHEWPTAA